MCCIPFVHLITLLNSTCQYKFVKKKRGQLYYHKYQQQNPD